MEEDSEVVEDVFKEAEFREAGVTGPEDGDLVKEVAIAEVEVGTGLIMTIMIAAAS